MCVGKKDSIACEFDDAYSCGYYSESKGAVSFVFHNISGPGPNSLTSPIADSYNSTSG
jgi:hypothetical protein